MLSEKHSISATTALHGAAAQCSAARSTQRSAAHTAWQSTPQHRSTALHTWMWHSSGTGRTLGLKLKRPCRFQCRIGRW